jgi:rubrerythrin
MVRGTSEAEVLLKNARTEFKEEAEEIANYTAIQNLAQAVGDKDTADLAKAILREEKRMAGFLEKLIPRLTKSVVQSDIPRSERSSGRRRTSSRRAASTTRKRTTSGRARSTSARAGTKRKTTSRSRSTSARSGATRRTTAGRKTSARKTSARKASARKTTARKRTTAGSSR